MKLIVCGNHNPYFFNTVECREKALRELGHEVLFFDTRDYRLPGVMRQSCVWCQRWDVARNSRNLVELARREKPDICLVVGGNVAPEAVRELSSLGARTSLWTTDPPHDFKEVIRSAPAYDRVFCSGTEAMDILEAKAALQAPAVWLPFACDPGLHCPAELDSTDRLRYARDVAFVGSYYPNRAEMLEPLAEFEPGIWGPYWNRVGKRSPLRPFIHDQRVAHDEWRKIYTAAQVVVVVHYQDGITPCCQASPKLFESLACGAFVLCDEQRDAQSLFRDGEQVVYFRDAEDLYAKVQHYLAHPDERARIAAAGRQETLERHSWRVRMQQFLDEAAQ